MYDIILFAHPTFGVLGILAAVWVFVETLNARENNLARTRIVATIAAVCIVLAGVLGGYWYVRFYEPDKALILGGPWPWAHSLLMEVKEHAFFIMLILALYLPVAARDRLDSDLVARRLVLAVAALIVLSGLALEGAGAVVSSAVKLSLQTGEVFTGGE
jgi:hypothetical protein